MAELSGGAFAAAAPVTPASAIVLPAPRPQIFATRGQLSVDVSDGMPGQGIVAQVNPTHGVRVIAEDLPFDLLQAGGQSILLETLRWEPNRGRGKTGGWVHPSHETPSGNGTFMRGGAHNDQFGNPIAIQRPTEFPITVEQQTVDLTQSVFSFMELADVPFREYLAGPPGWTISTLRVLRATRAKRSNGGQIPYQVGQRGYRIGRFAFRYSIVDQNDPRQKRLSGPISTAVNVGHSHTPFLNVPSTSAFVGPSSYVCLTLTVNPKTTWKEPKVWNDSPVLSPKPYYS